MKRYRNIVQDGFDPEVARRAIRNAHKLGDPIPVFDSNVERAIREAMDREQIERASANWKGR